MLKSVLFIIVCALYCIPTLPLQHQQYEQPSLSLNKENDLFATNVAPKRKKKPENKPCESEQFDGSDRKEAKLSIGSGKLTTFNDMNELIASLPTDNFMGTKHKPPIKTIRVEEEEQNVHRYIPTHVRLMKIIT